MSGNTRKGSKESLASKIVIVVVLGIVLLTGLAAIGVFLFSDLFPNNLIGDSDGSDDRIYQGLQVKDAGGMDKLTVEYTGGELYAGGQVNSEDFIVNVVYKDGTIEEVTGYNSTFLNEDFCLETGSNSIIFYYGSLSAVITVEATDINTLEFPPSYVTVKVDEEKANKVIEGIESGTVTYEEAFSRVVFTGDSQIKALSSYEIFTADRLLAKVGESFDYFDSNFDNIVSMCQDKEVLVVHYGINTLSTSESVRNEELAKYRNTLTRLKDALPDVRIIVSGVFPVSRSIYFNQERFSYITEFDRKIFGMCQELGIEYLSDNQYITEHQEVFGADGLHLTKQFYTEYWLKNLITTMGIY